MIMTILSILVLYSLPTTIFFFFPSLIHSKKHYKNPLFTVLLTSPKILRIAHRGGARHTTQNTLQSFTKILHKTDCLQMDICQTLDHVLVVHHDHSLLRTCGINKNISDYYYQKLPKFRNRIQLDFGVNQFVTTKQEKIPTLQSVFSQFNRVSMNIQLKNPTQTAMTSLSKLIYQHNKIDNTIVGIRNNKNFQFKKKHPSILNFTNDQKVYILLFAYFLGFLPYLPINQTSFQIPVYSHEYEQWNVGRTVQKDKWKVSLYMKTMKLLNFLTRPLIWHLKQRGVMSYAWVCNTRQAFDNAIKGGFQGIMTDDPYLLDQYLKEKKLRIED